MCGPQAQGKSRAAHPANEAILAQAGAWKDDPLLDEELKKIERSEAQ
jgi:hypothetical protein